MTPSLPYLCISTALPLWRHVPAPGGSGQGSSGCVVLETEPLPPAVAVTLKLFFPSLVSVNRVANVQPCSAVTAVSSPYLCCSYLPKVTHSLRTSSSRSSLRNVQSVPTRWPKYLHSAPPPNKHKVKLTDGFSTPSDILSQLENSRTCRLQGSHVAQQAASRWRRRCLFVRSSRVVPSVRQQ